MCCSHDNERWLMRAGALVVLLSILLGRVSFFDRIHPSPAGDEQHGDRTPGPVDNALDDDTYPIPDIASLFVKHYGQENARYQLVDTLGPAARARGRSA